jgi:hypothetical protein
MLRRLSIAFAGCALLVACGGGLSSAPPSSAEIVPDEPAAVVSLAGAAILSVKPPKLAILAGSSASVFVVEKKYAMEESP